MKKKPVGKAILLSHKIPALFRSTVLCSLVLSQFTIEAVKADVISGNVLNSAIIPGQSSLTNVSNASSVSSASSASSFMTMSSDFAESFLSETLLSESVLTVGMQNLIDKAEYYLTHSEGADKTAFADAIVMAKSLPPESSDEEKEDAFDALEKSMQEYLLKAEPTDGISFDLTFLITNPDLTESSEGWSDVPLVDYGEAEIYNRTFNLCQTLKNMRSGMYSLNVTGFHRNGNYAPGIENEGNAGCAIYANSFKQPLLTLYYDDEARQFHQTGGYANNMSEAAQIFRKGFYTSNNLTFEQVYDGDMTIGLQNANTREANWTCFKNFTLEYFGKNTGGHYAGMFRITDAQHPSGACVSGDIQSMDTPLAFVPSLPKGKTGYWIMREEKKHQFSLRNADSGKYLTWNGIASSSSEGSPSEYSPSEHSPSEHSLSEHSLSSLSPSDLLSTDEPSADLLSAKGDVSMTEIMHGDSSLWKVEFYDDNYCLLRNVHSPSELLDINNADMTVGTTTQGDEITDGQQLKLYTATMESLRSLDYVSFNDIIKNLTFDGRTPAFGKSDNFYLLTLPEERFVSAGSEIEIGYSLPEGYETLLINDVPVDSGAVYTFGNISGESYTLKIRDNDGYLTESELLFTAMPVVRFYGYFNDEYSDASISVAEPDVIGADTLIKAKIRWRGASTRYRMKKQYAIKLYDDEDESKDASFFGLRDDNNWILDGMSIDKARMRNRVVTDLWNHMAAKPYYFEDEPEALTGTRGHFVEAFLNDEYVGIYCMTEKMDRKQMKLKKIDDDTPEEPIRGELWKSSDWSYSVFMGQNYDSNEYPMIAPPSYDNSSETWDGYEVKHPDIGDGEPVDWKDLYDAVNFVASASDEDFKAYASEYFDVPVLVDYYILMETILSADNHGKNMYFGIYNRKKSKKITFAVWDLDSTCGRRWDSSEVKPSQDYTEYISYNEHGDYNLFRRMKALDVDAFNERVKARYAELRNGALHTDSIVKRFTDYRDLFELSGAAEREEKRWTETDAGVLDFDVEMDYLRNWFEERLSFVDNQWNVTGIMQDYDINSTVNSTIKVYGTDGGVVVETSAPAHISVYSVAGTLIRTADVLSGVTRISGLTKGIYIVNGRKAVVQ